MPIEVDDVLQKNTLPTQKVEKANRPWLEDELFDQIEIREIWEKDQSSGDQTEELVQ